jgi:DNA-binding beta-propeller fold protein YncE
MNFLPAIPLSAIPATDSHGGVAVNADGTLFASVDSGQHCVYMYNMVDRTAHPVVIGTAGTAGSAHGQLDYPGLACFVHRNGVDTLLICDFNNDRVVEFTVSGVFLRVIAFRKVSGPWGIAERDGVIAVTLRDAHAVVQLQYESNAMTREVTIGSEGRGDGKLCRPMGVAFTADGRYILVADFGNHRVSKFSAASGAFIAHVATKAANGIVAPRDVLQCEDGSIVVAQGSVVFGNTGSDRKMVCVGEDGVTVQNVIIPSPAGVRFFPYSFCYSSALSGVVVKTFAGNMFLLRDAWICSNRCSWLSALAAS